MARFELLGIFILFVWKAGNTCTAQQTGLMEGYYQTLCPSAEDIIRDQVDKLYHEHGNTAVSWLRTIFHDCMVESCDASILLETTHNLVSEQESERNFGMRNFKYVNAIKNAVEEECPGVVSCADIITLAVREGTVMLGGPRMALKTGRRDSQESSAAVTEKYMPLHNDSLDTVLDRFETLGIDAEGTVALLGAHTVGRTHCVNLVNRLYPTVDSSIDPDYAVYLKGRCPTPNPEPTEVLYSRNDPGTR